MQVSGLSNSSAAAALRELFKPPQSSAQEMPSAGQQMPSGGSRAMQGMGGVQMSSEIMSSLMGMQSEGKPGASDIASHMLADLDADGDGALSLEEATANSSAENASEAFATLDIDGDGSLTLEELTSAVEQSGPPTGGPPPGGPHGAPPSSGDVASTLLSSIDSDEDDSLSLSEITNAIGAEEDEETASAFSSLDTDGDGKLSLAELTAALDKYVQAGASRFAEQSAIHA